MAKRSADALRQSMKAQAKQIEQGPPGSRFEKVEQALSVGRVYPSGGTTRVDRSSFTCLPEETEILDRVFKAAVQEVVDVKRSHLLRVGMRMLGELPREELARRLRELPPVPGGDRGRKKGSA